MKVLIYGSGGREHALAWKLEQSPLVEEVFVTPGNGGTAFDYKAPPGDILEIEDLAEWAASEEIQLTVIGPEAPLVLGMADCFREKGLKVFGPSAKGAQLEGSKVFAKELMEEFGIPTGSFKVFSHSTEALSYLDEIEGPIVIKADGLAAGKGVSVVRSKEEAKEIVKAMMVDKVFGEAGDRILIEEFLEGEEASILALTDGERYLTLAPSSDHKRAFDGDQGENTGGMGAFSPTPIVDNDLQIQVEERIIRPTLKGLRERGIEYRGVLYIGLMVTKEGPFVLEYNCRFGDPETQVVLPRMAGDLLPILMEVAEGRLLTTELSWDPRVALCVIMASGGYPKSYQKGYSIEGLDRLGNEDVLLFHAGTTFKEGAFLTDGGRVLGVVSLGDDYRKAKERVYQAVQGIHFHKKHYRRDIGDKAIKGGESDG